MTLATIRPLSDRAETSDAESVAASDAVQPIGWFSLDDVGRRLGCQAQAVQRRIQNGEIKGQKIGRRWWVPPDEMARIVGVIAQKDVLADAVDSLTEVEQALEHSRTQARVLTLANRELNRIVRELEELLPSEEGESLASKISRYGDGRWTALVRCTDGETRRFYAKSDAPVERRRYPLAPGLRFEILTRDGFRCRYCGRDADEVRLHVDHVIPVVLGGTNDPANLVTACQECNLGKSDTELPTPPHPGSDREGDMDD